ncbi:aquaporin [soil metagenome]
MRRKSWLAEFIGSFALLFIGVGAIAAGGDLVAVALAHGLTIAAMVTAFGPLSGAHFNPAVTLAFLVTGRIGAVTLLSYWSAQLAGSSLATALLASLYCAEALVASHYGAPRLQEGLSLWAGAGIESVITFFLATVIFAVTIQRHANAGLYIGAAVTLCALGAGPLTGAAMNPARAFGPALVSGAWEGQWIYWLGPFAGAALAALVLDYVYHRPAAQGVLETPPQSHG